METLESVDNGCVNMTSGQKVALSLLSAFALFAAFVLSFHTFLFKEIELKFYTQAKIEENVEQLNNISKSYDDYINKVLEKIETGDGAYLKDVSVRSYYTQNPSEKDIARRRALTEELFRDIPGLDGIRIIEKNGKNVHFSTYDDTDILKQSGISKIYKNYSDIVEDADEIPYEILAKKLDDKEAVLIFDDNTSRVIIAAPFDWSDKIVSLFYFKLNDMENELVKRDILSVGQGMQIVADDNLSGVFVLGVPNSLKEEFRSPVNEFWKSNLKSKSVLGLQKPEKLFEKDDGTFYVALSSTIENSNRVVGVYTSDLFEISTEIKLLVYICLFISAFLIIFLLFSLKQDPIVVLKRKIKNIQYGVIKEYVDNKEKIEWKNVVTHLKNRKKDLSEEILKSVNVHSKKKKKELGIFLEKNWDEIFAVIDGSNGDNIKTSSGNGDKDNVTNVSVSADSELLREIRSILNEVLAGVHSENSAAYVGGSKKKSKKVLAPATVVEELDDLEDVEEIEEVEELDDAEDIEELDDVEEIEELDDLEDVEEIEEVEEIDDAEDVEELDEVEELDNAEDVEELDEVEELNNAEDVEEIEEVEELDNAEDVEELDEAEELDDVEDIEELDDAEEIEELDDDIEDLEEADEDAELGHINQAPTPAFGLWDDEFFKNFTGAFNYEYSPSNNTFFASECFPTVENLFAEELALGSYVEKKKEFEITPTIKIFPVEDYANSEDSFIKEDDSVEDITLDDSILDDESLSEDVDDVEELPESIEKQFEENENPVHYSMTTLGETFVENPPVLDGVEIEKN